MAEIFIRNFTKIQTQVINFQIVTIKFQIASKIRLISSVSKPHEYIYTIKLFSPLILLITMVHALTIHLFSILIYYLLAKFSNTRDRYI